MPVAVRDMKKELQEYLSRQRMHKGLKGGQREEQVGVMGRGNEGARVLMGHLCELGEVIEMLLG